MGQGCGGDVKWEPDEPLLEPDKPVRAQLIEEVAKEKKKFPPVVGITSVPALLSCIRLTVVQNPVCYDLSVL